MDGYSKKETKADVIRRMLRQIDALLASEDALSEQDKEPEPEPTAWEKALEKAAKQQFEAGILRLN